MPNNTFARRLRRALSRRYEQENPSNSKQDAHDKNYSAGHEAGPRKNKEGGSEPRNNEHDSYETPSERSVARSTRMIAILTGALVFVSIISAVISYYQWKEIDDGSRDTHTLAVAAKIQADAAQGQLEQMKLSLKQVEYQSRSFAATQEAFVDVASGPIVFSREFVEGDLRFVYQPVWDNSGNTQTVNLRVETHCPHFSIATEDFENVADKNRMIVGKRIIGPHKTAPGTQCTFTVADITNIMQQRYIGYIWLRARYDDIFGNNHITEWCGRIDAGKNPADLDVSKMAGVAFNTIACVKHNCAEDQCRKG